MANYACAIADLYKPSAHAHRHRRSMGAYGTSQGGGAWGGARPPSLGGVGGYPPSRLVCDVVVPWFVSLARAWLITHARLRIAINQAPMRIGTEEL